MSCPFAATKNRKRQRHQANAENRQILRLMVRDPATSRTRVASSGRCGSVAGSSRSGPDIWRSYARNDRDDGGVCRNGSVSRRPGYKKGEQLFTDRRCTRCHSNGEKGNKKGPLDGVASKLSAAEIREWITDAKGMTAKTKATRKPEMKAYSLAKDDVDALAAYLGTLKKAQSVVVLGAQLAAGFDARAPQVLFFCLVMWLGGGMLYIWIISVIFYRYTFFTMQPSDLAPPYWINMGAVAISTLARSLLVLAAPHSPLVRDLLPSASLRSFVLGCGVSAGDVHGVHVQDGAGDRGAVPARNSTPLRIRGADCLEHHPDRPRQESRPPLTRVGELDCRITPAVSAADGCGPRPRLDHRSTHSTNCGGTSSVTTKTRSTRSS